MELFTKKFTFIVTGALVFFLSCSFLLPGVVSGADLSGRILLQVEQGGEAWYVDPENRKRHFMGRPADAFKLMQNLGVGITTEKLDRVPIGDLDDLAGEDSDEDGLPDTFEEAVSTDPDDSDTDGDGHTDKTEIEHGYDPLEKEGRLPLDKDFARKQQGKIFLQVEDRGQAWYINPEDNRRYFLGRPADAFRIMRESGLGITDRNLEKIPKQGTTSSEDSDEEQAGENNEQNPLKDKEDSVDKKGADTPSRAMEKAARAIRQGDKEKAAEYFIPEMERVIKNTIDFLDEEGRETLADILLNSELSSSSSTEEEKIYTTEVQLGEYDTTKEFPVQKQDEGGWLLADI